MWRKLASRLVLLVLGGAAITDSVRGQSGETTGGQPPPANAERLIPSSKAFVQAFRTPITFFGKVVDQNGAEVPEAAVRMETNDNPDGKPSVYNVRTDARGLFSIHDVHGITLTVNVSKPGYYSVHNRQDGKPSSNGQFWYAMDGGSGIHQPNESKPVVFVLRQQGTPVSLVKVGNRIRMRRDGGPVALVFDSKTPRPVHQMEVQCSSSDLASRAAGERKYDWKMEISVPQGGLQTRKDELDFQAPEAGYEPSETISMPANSAQWSNSAKRSYFVKFSDGTYARVDLTMITGDDPFLIWKSYLNPKPADRNLEAAPKDKP
jgi:hypothetical protein